jgi:hypothetical protein
MKKLRPGHTNVYGKWPRGVRVYIYDAKMGYLDESRDQRFDLHDNLFQAWPGNSRRAHLGIAIKSKNWLNWDEESLREIEERIIQDFEFDGEIVKLQRQTPARRPCTEEFVWRLDIRSL